MGYNARNDEIRSIVLSVLAILASAVVANARDIEIRCPGEGLFDAPPLLAGDVPNPAAGWQIFMEGKPRKVELSSRPESSDGFWLITCHVDVGGALIEINAHISGRRMCRFLDERRSTPSNGGHSCMVGSDDNCLIVCH